MVTSVLQSRMPRYYSLIKRVCGPMSEREYLIQPKQSHNFRTRSRASGCSGCCEDVESPVPSIIGNGLALPFFPCVPKMIG